MGLAWASHFHSCATLAFHCTAGVVCGNYGLRSAQILRWPHLIRRTPEPELEVKHVAFMDDKSCFCKQLQLPGVPLRFEHIDRAEKKGEPFLGTGSRRLGWVASLWTILPLLATGRRGHETLLHDTSWHIHSVYANLLRLLSPTVMQWKIIRSSSRVDFCRVTLMFSTTTRHGGPQFANLGSRQINKKKTRWSDPERPATQRKPRTPKKLRKR